MNSEPLIELAEEYDRLNSEYQKAQKGLTFAFGVFRGLIVGYTEAGKPEQAKQMQENLDALSVFCRAAAKEK